MKRSFLYCLALGLVSLIAVVSVTQSKVEKIAASPKAEIKIQSATKSQNQVNPSTKPVVVKKISRESQFLVEWNAAEPGSEERSFAMQRFVAESAPVVDRLLEMQNQLPEEDREDFVSVAIECLVPEAPAEAARLAEVIGNSDALSSVALLWGAQDPLSAAAWTLKHVEEAPEIVAPLISKWAESDPMAASQWLVTLPAGAARDAGAILLLPQLLETDAEAAAAWINNISDPTARAGMAAQLANAQAVTTSDF